MKITTKQIALTGIMLAIIIVSQFFKNASVYATGSVVNMVLILNTVWCGPVCGALLSVIAPITAFFITGSPLISAVPLILPAIMLGNLIYVLVFHFQFRLTKKSSIASKKNIRILLFIAAGVVGAFLKAAFMGTSINLCIIPFFGANLPAKMVAAAKLQFSIVQLITALIGTVAAAVCYGRINEYGQTERS